MSKKQKKQQTEKETGIRPETETEVEPEKETETETKNSKKPEIENEIEIESLKSKTSQTQKTEAKKKLAKSQNKKSIVLLLIFILILLSILFYVFFIQKKQIESIKQVYDSRVNILRDDINQLLEDKREIMRTLDKSKTEFDGYEVINLETNQFNQKQNQAMVINREKIISQFIIESGAEARIFKKINNNLYIGILGKNNGQIGYETFNELYKTNTLTGETTQMRISITRLPGEKDEIYINDIAGNEKYLAIVFGRTVYIEDLFEGKIIKEIPINGEFFHIGGALFSPDNQKLAFATTSSYSRDNDQKAVLYIYNLSTDQITEQNSTNGGFYNIIGWSQDQNSADYEILNFNSGL